MKLKPNLEVTNMMFEIIENQIENNDPPETKLTLDRLIKEGHNKTLSMKLIAQCLLIEMNRMVKFNELFDNNKYVKSLSNLPNTPEE